MTITEQMYSILAGLSGLTALVPATRILPPGNWQNIARPYIVHFPVAVVPTITHDDFSQALQVWEFYQISVFCETFQSGDAIASYISRNLPGNYSGTQIFLRAGTPFYQGARPLDERLTTQVHHFVLEFRVAEAL